MFKSNMKKALALLASLVLLCSIMPVASLLMANATGTNVVLNGGFEDGGNNWSFNSGTHQIVTDAKSGEKAVSLTNPGLWASAAEQTVAVSANSEYTITWYSKRAAGTGVFNLYVMNANGYANLESTSGKNWMNETSGNWVKNEYVVKTGTATSVILKFSTEASNPGTILLDDVSMTRNGGDDPDAPGGSNEPIAVDLKNGDFETGDTTGWEVYQGTAATADAKNNGSYGLHLTGNGGWGGMAYQDVTVEPGKEYTIKLWVKTLNNGVNIQVKDGGTSGGNLANQWFSTKEWTELTFLVIPTTDVLCLNFCGGGNGIAESVYLDDVTITTISGEQPASDNMLKNGDFENGTADWENVWGSCTVEVVSGRDSEKALKVSAGQWNIVRQKVTVEADTDYIVTVWSKDVNKMGLLVKDGNDSKNLKQGDLASGSDWKQSTMEFNSGSNTSVYVCVMGNEAGATATIDDFVMYKKGGNLPEDSNGLVNGDFETGDLSGWVPCQQTAISADAKKNGSYGAILKGDGGWGGLLDQDLTVEAGKDYTLTFWYKAISGGANFVVKENGSALASCWANANAWTQVTLEFTASSEALLLNICGGGDYVASEIYVDDFVLTAKGGSEPDQPVTPPSGDAGLVNGDFETGDLTGWEAWQQTEISADAKKNGSYGAHLKGTGGWGGLLDQTFSVEAGKDYILTFWYKANASGFNVQIKNNGAAIENGSAWCNANAWTQVTLEFNAPSDSLLLNLCGGGTGVAEDIYLDDVVLTEKPAAPGHSAELINGNFENGDEGWSLGSFSSIVSDDTHNGTGALKIENPSAWAEAALQTVAVKPNTNYVINWYAKRVSGAGAFNLILMKEDNANYSCDGQNWMNETSGDWTKYEVIITTDAMGVIKFKFTAEGASAGVILIDDITLTEEGEEPVDPTGNMIKNGSFENGKDDWAWSGATTLSKDSYIGEASARLDFDKAYGEALTQVVKVEPGQDYVMIWWTRRISGGGAWDLFLMDYDSINVTNTNIDPTSGNKWFQQTSKEWTESRIEFNSGEASKVFIKFGPESSDAGVFLLDEVGLYVKGTEPTDPVVPPTPPKTSMYMTQFGVLNNRPISEDSNLLIDPSFEAGNGQWANGFNGDTISVVEDETTKFGDKSLFFNTAGLAEETKVVFWMDVEADTDYVFSTWLKGKFLADDNRGNATIGVVDADGNFLTMSSTEDKLTLFLQSGTRQIVPTAWDNEWHLRGISFNSGDATKIGIALAGTNSQMYIDDMALFVVGQGVKYMSENMKGSVTLSYSLENGVTCKDEDSLIPDPNFTTKDKSGFWADSYGWRNGFLSFADNKYEYGTSLKYTASEEKAPLSIVKWIEVEPNTDYVFAVDLKILEDGFGKLALVDDKLREKQNFVQISFDSYEYTEAQDYYGWYTVAQKFNTGVYTRIGIAVVDDGGEVLLDNMRLFKNEDGAKVVDSFIAPPKTEEPEEAPEEDVEDDYDDYYDDYYDEDYDDYEPEDIPEEEPEETPEDEPVVEPEQQLTTLQRIIRLLRLYSKNLAVSLGLGESAGDILLVIGFVLLAIGIVLFAVTVLPVLIFLVITGVVIALSILIPILIITAPIWIILLIIWLLFL